MFYNIKGTGVAITDEIRDYVEKKLSVLDKFFGKKSGVRTDVELQFLSGEAGMFRAEGTLHDHGLEGDFRAEARGGSLHEALDIMVGELSEELSRSKKKLIHDKRRGALRFKDFIRGFTDRF